MLSFNMYFFVCKQTGTTTIRWCFVMNINICIFVDFMYYKKAKRFTVITCVQNGLVGFLF